MGTSDGRASDGGSGRESVLCRDAGDYGSRVAAVFLLLRSCATGVFGAAQPDETCGRARRRSRCATLPTCRPKEPVVYGMPYLRHRGSTMGGDLRVAIGGQVPEEVMLVLTLLVVAVLMVVHGVHVGWAARCVALGWALGHRQLARRRTVDPGQRMIESAAHLAKLFPAAFVALLLAALGVEPPLVRLSREPGALDRELFLDGTEPLGRLADERTEEWEASWDLPRIEQGVVRKGRDPCGLSPLTRECPSWSGVRSRSSVMGAGSQAIVRHRSA
jgi:hypothetical protein